MKVLETLLEITLYSAVIFGLIAAVKAIFKTKISPMLHYAVWAILVLRLILPVTLESPVHLITLPVQETVSEEGVMEELIVEESAVIKPIEIQPIEPAESIVGEGDALQQVYEEELHPEAEVQQVIVPETALQEELLPESAPAEEVAPPMQDKAPQKHHEAPAIQLTAEQIILGIWIIGMGVGFCYIAAMYIAMRVRLRRGQTEPTARLMNIYETVKAEMGIDREIPLICSCGLSSPGLMFPGDVVIPPEKLTGLSDEAVSLIFRHELTHYKRGDQLVCMLLSLLTAVYWFNPIVWMASAWIRKDMETACDSMVVKKMRAEEKRDYAALIIELLSRSKHTMAMLGMAEGGVKTAKKRILGIFMKGRSNMSAKIIAGVMSVLLLICCFTTACTPVEEAPPPVIEEGPAEVSENTEAPIVTEEKRNIKNILLLGMEEYQTQETPGDFAILCSLDLDNGTTDMLTIPRDLYINGSKFDQIYVKSGSDGVAAAFEKMFSEVGGFDVTIDGYLQTDFASLPKIAELIGDVKVTLEYDFPEIGNQGDTVIVNKDNIEYYLRERRFTGGSANREARQREYIRIMLQRAAAEKNLELTDATDYFASDLTEEQLTEILMAFGESNVSEGVLETNPGVTEDGSAVLYAEETFLAEYVKAHFAGGETAEQSAAAQITQPKLGGIVWNEVIENVTGAKWYIDLLTEANDAETYPIYSIQRKQFTSEEIEKIAAPFIEGATGMRDGRISTIEQLQRNIDGANALKYSDYKEEIKYYEEELKTASHQKYESVKEFPVTENIDRYSYYVYRMPDASNPSIMQSTDTLLIKSDNNRIMQLDEHTLDGTNNVKKSERKKLDGERISEQQAIAKAQEYLRQVGIDGFDVVATEKASQLDGNFMTVESIGWTITFVRTMGAGIPFNPNKRLKDNVFYNAVNPSQKGQRRRIAPEYIQIYSDYSGVQEFEWWNQLKITGVISENAQLLSFKEITGILKREIEKMPDWNKAEFNVNNLFLTYVPIGEESLQLRPIWIVSYELIDG
ncbi:MAG: LCP family protein, partial [Christensenellaceae bacterium]|nr:LCP family protein [Christensenellaceae bacterium]